MTNEFKPCTVDTEADLCKFAYGILVFTLSTLSNQGDSAWTRQDSQYHIIKEESVGYKNDPNAQCVGEYIRGVADDI